jgi:polyketide synthase-associated protein
MISVRDEEQDEDFIPSASSFVSGRFPAATFDVKDSRSDRQSQSTAWLKKASQTAEILQQKGFCLVEGDVESTLMDQAITEARRHKAVGSFTRPPREAQSGLFGDGSAWTKELSSPGESVPNDEVALHGVDEYLAGLGEEVAQFSLAYFGMALNGRCAGVVHHSRLPEEKANPPLLDPEEADRYYSCFCQKRLKVVFYSGPNLASMIISPIGAEFEAYRAQLWPGSVLIVRCDVCRVSIEPRQSQLCLVQEVEFVSEHPRPVVPLPPALEQWYQERFQAIVDNDVVENVPEGWLKAARANFFKNTPVRVVEMDIQLPTATIGKIPVPFEGSVFGGCDCISEIPNSKWDREAYYDEDRENVDDFKMYTRHMGALDLSSMEEEFEGSLFGISADEAKSVDKRHMMLAQSSLNCLKMVNMDRDDTRGKDLGIFAGLSGSDMFYAFMSRGSKLSMSASTNMSNAAGVNRISYMLGSTGPSIAVDTEDSSGAAATDTAVTNIRSDKCGLQALALGVNHIPHPVSIIFLCASGLISKSGRSRVFDETSDGFTRSEGTVTLLLQKHREGPLTRSREYLGLITGSAVNSKGVSASLLAPSASAIADVLLKAMQDTGGPASILGSVDVHASGNILSDAIEYGKMRSVLASLEEDPASVMLRNAASSVGSTGAASGLVSLAKVLIQIQRGAHGVCLHLHQLFEMGIAAAEDADSEEVGNARLRVPTEVVQVPFDLQTAGVASFGGSGTNVHHILSGIGASRVDDGPIDNSLNWFPSSIRGDVTTPKDGYYIIGSWNGWSEPVKMEAEEPGVYDFIVTMGDNMWETFLIWIDGDDHQVLHPDVHWSGKNSKVLGPDYIGRDYVWIIDARPHKVRMVTEKQKKALDAEKAEAIAQGREPAPEEFPAEIMFKADVRPPRYQQAEVSDMPLFEQNQEDWGVPGDRYHIRLHTLGSFKKVTWEKLVSESSSSSSKYEHKYFLTGDHNYWTREQEMQVEDGSYKILAHCLKDENTFQIVRDGDWDQVFYPKYPELTSMKSGSSGQEIAGPDGDGIFKKWKLPNKAGDVYEILFTRSIGSNGLETTRSISWKFVEHREIDFKEMAKSQEYSIVSSSTDFWCLIPMKYIQDSEKWIGLVRLMTGRKEEFIILMNQNWLSAVHPTVRQAHFLDDGHKLVGPDDGGDRMFWLIGKNEEDRLHLKMGDLVQVEMQMSGGLPSSIRWHNVKDQLRGQPPAEGWQSPAEGWQTPEEE